MKSMDSVAIASDDATCVKSDEPIEISGSFFDYDNPFSGLSIRLEAC